MMLCVFYTDFVGHFQKSEYYDVFPRQFWNMGAWVRIISDPVSYHLQ